MWIKVINLTKSYAGSLVLNKVNLHAADGEFILIRGSSGCGKTTLLKILAGLEPPDDGQIVLDNRIANQPEIVISAFDRQIGLLFQDLALWPHLTGREQLQLVLAQRISLDENVKVRIEAVCEQVQLPLRLLDRFPHQLSRGEQQRLAIARTIITQPQILLLDEPFTALDQPNRRSLLELMTNLKQSGDTTVIVVSHDLIMDEFDYHQTLKLENGQLHPTIGLKG